MLRKIELYTNKSKLPDGDGKPGQGSGSGSGSGSGDTVDPNS